MNIVITLPRELIVEIINGRKSVEVRTSIPRRFYNDEDVVLVVEKGTHNIPILFSIKQFITYDDGYIAFRNSSKDAAVSEEWLLTYCLGAKQICVWVIGRVCLIVNHGNATSTIGLKKNPQAFVYNDYDIAQFRLVKSFWSNRIQDEDKVTVFAPDIRNKILLDYLSTDCEVDFLQWCENNNIPFNWRGGQL